MTGHGPHRLVVALLGIALLLAGCSDIPPETQPQALDLGTDQGTSVPVQQPPKGANALQIVRDFISNSADPSDKHAAARAYLASPASLSWNDANSITIIADTFNTLASSEDTRDPNTQTVQVRGQEVGALGADDGFQPQIGSPDFTVSIRVSKQKNGQWRIVNVPDGVLIPQDLFSHNYTAIRVFFFDPNFGALVPDLRYVATNPRSGLPARVIDELLAGPSNALSGAVVSAIPSGVETATNPTEAPDGALVVNLAKLPEQNYHNKQLIIAQIVRSLQQVATNPVQVETSGTSLVTGTTDWRASQLPAYNLSTTPNGALPGLVVTHGRIVSLKNGSAVDGPAGTGEYQVVTAAQSIDGTEMAMVCQAGAGRELRIGRYGESAAVVNSPASTFTRPTWMPGDAAGDPSHEVWTVADGQVVRLLSTQQGTWYAAAVDASALLAFGTVTDLRLSRDGTRVAAIAGGHLLVGAVVVDQSSVSITKVVQLQAGQIQDAVGVDWLSQDSLVVATSQPTLPVLTVSVDGLTTDTYNTSNLYNPITAITAADSRSVVVTDPDGLWSSSDPREVWLPESATQSADAVPFYPG